MTVERDEFGFDAPAPLGHPFLGGRCTRSSLLVELHNLAGQERNGHRADFLLKGGRIITSLAQRMRDLPD